MSNEIENQIAVELSDSELDTVAGGLSFRSNSESKFSQKLFFASFGTFANSDGSGTFFQVASQETVTSSSQSLIIEN
jgi:hypothetical protein